MSAVAVLCESRTAQVLATARAEADARYRAAMGRTRWRGDRFAARVMAGPPKGWQPWPWEYEASRPVRWRWVRAPMYEGKGGRLDVTGTDRERVFKVASDRAALIHADPVLARKREATG